MSDNLNEEQEILSENLEQQIKQEALPLEKTLECNIDKKDFEQLNQNQQSKQDDNLRQFESKVMAIEAKAREDISKIQNLLNAGLINPLQGQNLMQIVMKKGYDELQHCGLDQKTSMQTEPQKVLMDKKQAIIEFEKENPDFFNDQGRLDVLNYIKSGSLDVDKDEISQISKLVEAVENAAVQRYLKKSEYESQIQKTNEVAKSRLVANAQNSKDIPSKLVAFTREQIGKMSGAEFTKNEKLIMEQLRQGLIR